MKKKRKRLRIGRLLIIMLIPIGVIALLVFGGIWVYGKLKPEEPKTNEITPIQQDVTAKVVKTDHAAQMNNIKQAKALDSVSVAGLTDDELRQLFYSQPLSEEQINSMTGVTFDPNQDFITSDQLRYIRVLYKDFEGSTRVGELVVNEKIAGDIENIFYELYKESYPIEKMILPEAYGGNDNTNMANDNTNAFSFRFSDGLGIVEHEHSLGLAVDVNPLYNPQVVEVNGVLQAFPYEGTPYMDRTNLQPHMISHDDAAYKIFTKYGFTWGGDWDTRQDYQHFEKYDHIPISKIYNLQAKLGNTEDSNQNPDQDQSDQNPDDVSGGEETVQ